MTQQINSVLFLRCPGSETLTRCIYVSISVWSWTLLSKQIFQLFPFTMIWITYGMILEDMKLISFR